MKKAMAMTKKFFDAGGYDFLYGLENKYTCGSICLTPLFYLAKNVADGPPVTDCFTAAVEDVSDNMASALLFFMSACILFLAVLGVFPLCRKDKDMYEELE
jgi:hypothetical protein